MAVCWPLQVGGQTCRSTSTDHPGLTRSPWPDLTEVCGRENTPSCILLMCTPSSALPSSRDDSATTRMYPTTYPQHIYSCSTLKNLSRPSNQRFHNRILFGPSFLSFRSSWPWSIQPGLASLPSHRKAQYPVAPPQAANTPPQAWPDAAFATC